MSKFAGEFTSHYVGEVLTWREYVTNLDLSHWGWENCTPYQDRQVVEFEDNLLAVPVFVKDILDDPEVRYIELPNHLLAISWDNFHYDVAVVKNEDIDEVACWLLVEKISDREYRVVNGAPSSFDAIQELAMQYEAGI
jgi:hypothetical protein